MIRRLATVAVCGAILALGAGCLAVAAAGAAGAGVAYVRGDLEAMVDATPPQIVDAAKAALEDMKLSIISSRSSSLDGEVVARTAEDRKVQVVVQMKTEKTSKVSIRVGTFGDEAMSQAVLDKIKAQLGAK